MSDRMRQLQWGGLLLIFISGFLPAFAWHVGPPHPSAADALGSQIVYIEAAGAARAPLPDVGRALNEWISGIPAFESLWPRRPNYAYVLLFFWVGALWLAKRFRRLAGVGLWLVTIAVLVLEAGYLRSDYLPFFPALLGTFEQGLAWFVVACLLVWRRKSHRSLGAVEGSIAAQALLALVHGITLPCTLARDLLPSKALPELLTLVGEAFQPGYWLGMLGFLMVCLPGYFGRRQAALDSARA